MTNGREPNATGEMQSDYFEVESRKKCQYRLRRPAHQRCSPPTSSCAPDAVRPSRPAHQMMNTLARLCLSTECCCSCQLQVSVLRTRCSSTESSCVPDAVRPSRPAYQMTRCGSTEPSRVPEMRFDRAVPRNRCSSTEPSCVPDEVSEIVVCTRCRPTGCVPDETTATSCQMQIDEGVNSTSRLEESFLTRPPRAPHGDCGERRFGQQAHEPLLRRIASSHDLGRGARTARTPMEDLPPLLLPERHSRTAGSGDRRQHRMWRAKTTSP